MNMLHAKPLRLMSRLHPSFGLAQRLITSISRMNACCCTNGRMAHTALEMSSQVKLVRY